MAAYHLLSLFFSLPLLSASAATPKIWNIDCGSTDGFFEDYTNLTWVGDGGYVKAGVNHHVPNTTGKVSDRDLLTLRAFPEGRRKNCYSVPVGANTMVQMWIRFYYGNYDGLEKPPSLKLLLDGNVWDTIQTKVDEEVPEVAIYVAQKNSTDICVGRIDGGGVPFVSSLQVVAFSPAMYSDVDPSIALYSRTAYAFGSDGYFRSPDDPYDRSWHPANDNVVISTNATLFVDAGTRVDMSRCPNNPPPKLFRAAIAPLGSSLDNLTITPKYLNSNTQKVYLSMYFTEVNASVETRKRVFDIYMDDQLISNASIAPVFGEAVQFSYLASGVSDATTFTLAPAKGSSLPPIISGFETSKMLDFPTGRTNDSDVETLSWLQGNFKELGNYTGDPCLPKDYNWEWLRCYTAIVPRVTKLYLNGYGLSGNIPDFSGLQALTVIKLENNNLSGSIPDFLSKFPGLEFLNLADNDFSSIPPALLNSNTVTVNVTGNPKLCEEGRECIYGPLPANSTPRPPPPSNGSTKTMALSVSVILLILALMDMI